MFELNEHGIRREPTAKHVDVQALISAHNLTDVGLVRHSSGSGVIVGSTEEETRWMGPAACLITPYREAQSYASI